MPEMTSGAALRQLQQAQAGMKKVRQAMRQAAGDPQAAPHLVQLGWESLGQTHRLLAAIPSSAVNDDVMTKQLAVQRYSTALLVRLRRLLRRDFSAGDRDEEEVDFEDEGD
jgi:hypothetical protein